MTVPFSARNHQTPRYSTRSAAESENAPPNTPAGNQQGDDKGLPHPGQSLLIVDDNQVLRDRLARAFRDRGFEVRVAGNYDEAVALAKEDSPELAVLDLRMPGKSGLAVLRELRDIDPTTKVIILTGFGSIATTVDAMRLGAVNYVPKPADVDDILAAFARAESPALEGSPVAYQAPTLARAEWEHINRVLADCGNNISEAARRLGIHRRSLQRKLQKLAPE